MPNWVTNRITVEGENAEEIIRSHFVKDDNGEDLFDFNTIIKMPDDLKIEKGSRATDGFKLYLTKISPLVDFLGEKEDKITPMDAYISKLSEVFGKNFTDFDKYRLNSDDVKKLKEHYKDDFDKVVELGEKAFNNIEKYGYPDWYDWSCHNWGSKWNACNSFQSNVDPKVVYFDTAWSPAIPAIEKFAKMHPELKITHEFAEEQTGFYSGRVEFENGEFLQGGSFEPYSKEAYEMSFDLWGCEDDYVFDQENNNYIYKEDIEDESMSEMC